jgi:UDPglucose 6-dehydrogenase
MQTEFVNIIGYGYVGGAMGYLCNRSDVLFCTCDVVKKDESNALENFDDIGNLVKNSELFNQINMYFVSVPTPSKPSGECDTTIVKTVLQKLVDHHTRPTIVYIKSTVQPGTCRQLQSMFGSYDLQIVFCPEFLREKTHLQDMYNAKFVLLGTETGAVNEDVGSIFTKLYRHQSDLEVVYRTYEECEMFKTTINTYLAVKVWYFNKVHGMCERLGFPYSNLHEMFKLEPRLGDSHTGVPGHDGLYGFGGSCLPKETRSLSFLQQKLGLSNKVLEEILLENNVMRSA